MAATVSLSTANVDERFVTHGDVPAGVSRVAMAVFSSYAHEDDAEVALLQGELEELVGPVWLDRALTGGQVWWEEILTQLRQCDLFVLALSPHSLKSQACLAELHHVVALHRPFLAVRISATELVAAPAALRRTQVIDFMRRDADSARALARAVLRVDQPGPLPEPLPEPPPMPLSYRDRFAGVFRSTLSVDEQLSLFARLKFDIDIGTNVLEATELLRRLHERPDLSWKIHHDISVALAAGGGPTGSASPARRRGGATSWPRCCPAKRYRRTR
jgi:hypothetical protein